MTNAEIDELLNSEYDDFLNKKYNGKIAIPENAIELFKTAILAMPSYSHKIMFSKVKNIAITKVKDLTNGDLHEIVKVVLNVPIEKLYPNINFFEKSNYNEYFLEVVDKCIAMDKFVLSYNGHVEEFQKKLQSKKVALTNLTEGVRGNGMRIIPKA